MSESRPMDIPKILFADDEHVTRMLLRQVVEENGFTAIECANGKEAIAAFASGPVDLVLLDVDMPNVDGYTACREIRMLPGGRYTPIVMVTGCDDIESVNRSYQAGANDFISKPINWAVLGHRLRYVLHSAKDFVALQASEGRIRTLIDALPDRVFRMSSDGRLLDMDPAQDISAVKGALSMDETGSAMQDNVDYEVITAKVRDYISDVLESGIETSFEWDNQSGDSNLCCEVRVVASGASEVLVIVRDITSRKQHENEIHKIAYYDSLTGLPNRRYFFDQLEREVLRSRRSQLGTAVLFLDIDRFKTTNDTLGHGAGDQLLQEVSMRLQRCIRAEDFIAHAYQTDSGPTISRIGGDEFTVIIGALDDANNLSRIAQRILDEISAPVNIDGRTIYVTASMGIATFPVDALSAETLVKYADTAMYQAKENGKNNYQFYSAGMNAQMQARVKLEAELREALQQNALEVYYQPKVAVDTLEINGLEALARWRHPQRGYISPGEFIPVAEDAGMIGQLGEWVLRQACLQMREWRSRDLHCKVAVNVSGRQLDSPDFYHMVEKILADNTLPGSCLELELTESSLMKEPDRMIAVLNKIKALGITIAIDDFGTGYSSLSYLTRFPLDVLKIDRGFVSNIFSDASDEAVIKSVISLGRSLQMRLVGEGVETLEQFEFLKSNGCDTIQGFLFSKPLPVDECEQLLERGGFTLQELQQDEDEGAAALQQ